MKLPETDKGFVYEALLTKLVANSEAKGKSKEEKKEIYGENQKVFMKSLKDKFGKEMAKEINEHFKTFRKENK